LARALRRYDDVDAWSFVAILVVHQFRGSRDRGPDRVTLPRERPDVRQIRRRHPVARDHRVAPVRPWRVACSWVAPHRDPKVGQWKVRRDPKGDERRAVAESGVRWD